MLFASRDLDSSTVSWVSDPDGRGTFSLITSCVLTMGLCVWTALHLNLPPPSFSRKRWWLESVKWALTGIFAPELMVFVAWRQYISARVLQSIVKECAHNNVIEDINEEKPRNTSPDAFHNSSEMHDPDTSWTMVHGFYALMDGFAFDVDFADEEPDLFGTNHTRLTITSRGIALLARCGRLPFVQKAEIVDKSKSDSIAKSLACLQAGWMIVQTLSRVAFGLPVTLLEVNTLGHILCAFVIYVLWWHKPQTILEPTKLAGAWIKPLCAYMYICSKISGSNDHHINILARRLIKPELSALALSSSSFASRAHSENMDQMIETSGSNEDQGETKIPCGKQLNELNVNHIHSLRFFHKQNSAGNTARNFEVAEIDIERNNNSSIHLRRWQLAAEAVSQYPAIRSRFREVLCDSVDTIDAATYLEPSPDAVEDLIVERVGNWPSPGLLRGMGGLIMGMILWFATMAFGGIHAATWNGYFPSIVESWMWRASSVHVVFCGFLWLMINLVAKVCKRIDLFWDRVVALQEDRITYIFLGILCFIGGFTFVIARIFLVIEAFVSLRKLPSAAYKTPDWTQLVPHI